MITNYLSIDFESWAYPDLPEYESLTGDERKKLDNGYVKDSAREILEMLKRNNIRLTFFILGQLYDWYPKVIEEIAQNGHEIAYHTYSHDIIRSQKDLINSLVRSKKFLGRFQPKGFRAPLFSNKKEYFPILRDYGFKYDSSFYDSYLARGLFDGILELPVSKIHGLPVGSGYLIASMGKKVCLFSKGLNKKGHPFIGFLHNWQIVKPEAASFPNWRYLYKRPHYIPYTFSVREVFKYLLKSIAIAPMEMLI